MSKDKKNSKAERIKIKGETRKFFADFKKFLTRGNILDLAVGIVVGAAFTAIVNALVQGIIMPFVSVITGKNFENWVWVLNGLAVDDPEAILIKYGVFIQAVLNFLIIGFTMFMLLRVIMRAKGFEKEKFFGYTRKEYKAFRKSGKKRADIEAIAIERDQAAAQAQAAAAEEQKRHTTEYLLENIRDLLAKQAQEPNDK